MLKQYTTGERYNRQCSENEFSISLEEKSINDAWKFNRTSLRIDFKLNYLERTAENTAVLQTTRASDGTRTRRVTDTKRSTNENKI